MRVAIVGGGVAGLTCAHELAARGHQPIVLEREARPGGKVGTERASGYQIELGPVGVLDNAPDTVELVRALGLETVTSSDAMRRRYLYLDGKLAEVPESPPELITTRTLTLGEKLRLFAEPLGRKPPEGREETVAEFARRRFGSKVAERVVEPAVSGIFAGDWLRLSYPSVLPKVAELERAHGSLLFGMIALERARKKRGEPRVPARLTSFPDGMGALPDALAATLGDAVKLGSEALALRATGARTGGYRLRTPSGELEVDRVVLALPPDEAARLTRPVDAALADALAGIPLNAIAAVSLGYRREAVTHALDGFGYLVPRKEGRRLLGAIFVTSTFPDAGRAPDGHVLLRAMIGGATDPDAVALDDARLIALAHEELAATVGLTGEPAFTHVVRWQKGIAQYVLGHASRVELITSRGEPRGLYVTGAALRGVGVNDVIRDARQVAARLA